MARLYKIIEARNEFDSYALEELESKINRAAKDGYRLEEESIQVFHEDRGPTQTPLCLAIAVMFKKEKAPKKLKNPG